MLSSCSFNSSHLGFSDLSTLHPQACSPLSPSPFSSNVQSVPPYPSLPRTIRMLRPSPDSSHCYFAFETVTSFSSNPNLVSSLVRWLHMTSSLVPPRHLTQPVALAGMLLVSPLPPLLCIILINRWSRPPDRIYLPIPVYLRLPIARPG